MCAELLIRSADAYPPDRGLFVWHELNTTDIESAERFYSKLIGWKTRAWDPNPAYKIWTMGREGRGGLYSIHEERNVVLPPPHWLSYLGTADVDATVRQAVELGGKVATPAYDVPGVGRMAVLHDPQVRWLRFPRRSSVHVTRIRSLAIFSGTSS